MTETDKPLTLPDGSPVPEKPKPQGIEFDRHGDPLLQGTKMLEKESYERVIDGLRIAAEAAAHLTKSEPGNSIQWRGLSKKLDQCRRICVQHAGLGLVMKEPETAEAKDPMNWRWARDRFRYGIKQASGGCLQLATCFRMDLWWSKMSRELEGIELKLRPKSMDQIGRRKPKLVIPGTLH